MQQQFLERFRRAFDHSFRVPVLWTGGQGKGNRAGLPVVAALCRGGKPRKGEEFELGDLRTHVSDQTVIVEFESSAVSLHHLAKYVPFICGAMSIKPSHSVLLCHFSDWGSWGSHRYLWDWHAQRISVDPNRIVDFSGHQFDHGGKKHPRADQAIQECLSWIRQQGVS